MTPEEFAENLKNEIDEFVKKWEQDAEKLKNEIDEFVKAQEQAAEELEAFRETSPERLTPDKWYRQYDEF